MRMRGKEESLLVDAMFIADLPQPVRPSDSEPVHGAWSRLDHLYRISKLLGKFESTEKTVSAILAIVSNILPLRSATLIDETESHAQVSIWKSQEPNEEGLRTARNHATASYAYLSGSRSTSETNASIARQRPISPKSTKDSTPVPFILIPLVVDRQPIFGAFQLEGVTAFNEADLMFVNAIANQLAVALDRHKAWQQERSARAEAETAERRMRFLADASRLLAVSFDYRTTWENMARLAVLEIADYCLIDIVENQALRRMTVLSPDLPSEITQEQVKSALASIVRHVLKTHRAVVYPATNGRERMHKAKRKLDNERDRSFESYICVPLRADEKVLGTLTLVSTRSDHLYKHRDLVLIEDLARRAVVAFENAQLYSGALEAIRSRDDVLHAVSHDLKGPLANVLGFVRISLDKAPSEKPLICDRKQLEAIERAAKQMSALISDLLDTASIDAGYLYVEREACAVAPLIEEAMELQYSLVRSKGLHFRNELPPDLPSVSVDRHRVLQVFANLIGNAVKFTPPGGTIIVRAEPVGDRIEFSVEDTGKGIAKDEIPHLFDRFWQARKTARQGTGLGLFIVKGIVEGHGGRIWVESEVRAGSKFHFTLPTNSGESSA